MQLIDTHCHIADTVFDKDREQVIKNAHKNNTDIINISVNLQNSKDGIALSKKYDGVYTTIGFDPQETVEGKFDEALFEDLLITNRQHIVGIGEIGLEYFRQENFKYQREVFIAQIKMAKKYDLPISIHCRDFRDDRNGAYNDLITILKEQDLPKKGVVHCFGGTLEYAKKSIELGYYLGLNGIVTFDKTGQLESILKEIGLGHVILETDSPYLTPDPFRGQRNEPAYVSYVAKKISGIMEISIDEVISITTKNAKKLFNI